MGAFMEGLRKHVDGLLSWTEELSEPTESSVRSNRGEDVHILNREGFLHLHFRVGGDFAPNTLRTRRSHPARPSDRISRNWVRSAAEASASSSGL